MDLLRDILSGYYQDALQNPYTTDFSDLLPTFVVRVQLANAHEYPELHKVMEKYKFKKTVVAKDGALKALPDATYSHVAETEYLTSEAVCGYARKAIEEHLKNTGQEGVGIDLFVSTVKDAWFELQDAKIEEE